MKKVISFLLLFIFAPFSFAHSMTIQEIMDPNFKIRVYVEEVYDQIKQGKDDEDRLRLADEWTKLCARVLERDGGVVAKKITAAKDLIAGTIVGLYFTNKLYYKKNQKLLKENLNKFGGLLSYACYQLGAINGPDDPRVATEVYLPLLKYLAQYAAK